MKNTLHIAFLLLLAIACNPAKNCVEKINPDCVCTMQYDPVCGCNNKTYGNACAAECAGIKKYTKGACPQDAEVRLEATAWQLTNFASGAENQAVPADISISIKFEDGKLNGHGGCNNIGGTYIHDGNKVTVSGLFSTKMYCEAAMRWESQFLQWLPQSQSYTIQGETLEINCGDAGRLIFRQNWKKRN